MTGGSEDQPSPTVTYEHVKVGASAFLDIIPRRWALGPMEAEIIVQQIFEAAFGGVIQVTREEV